MKTEYSFILTDDLSDKTPTNIYPYLYKSTGWRDQLLSYNGETFTYDEIGNPTTYRNKTLSWSHARQLDSFDTHTFKYNANGIRIQKDNIKFFLNGNKIISQTDGTDTLFFYYGTDGITGFNHNGTDYFYKKNIQGDIIGIYNPENKLICKYIYDAWGNHVCRILSNNGEYVDNSDNETYNYICNTNPFRYRGYYYDTETGLYYLNSRYYDPQTGRFINADDISILNELQEELNGLNLYTYCFNNPVNDIDELGSWSWKKIFGWIVVAVVAVVAVATIVVGSIVSSGILGAALTGAGIGALTAMGTSIYVQGGFLNASPLSVVQSGLIGGTIGAISGIVSYGFGLIGQEIGKSIGMIFANTTHLSSGIAFGKVFGTGLLMSIGSAIGKILGGFIGGTVTNYIFNYIQSNKLSTEEMLTEGFIGEIPGWILDTFKWLFSY